MRRLATVCLGLALSAPATAWSQAGGSMPDLTLENEQYRLAELEAPDYQQMKQELQQAQAMGMDHYYGGHICEQCARKLPERIAVDPSMAPTGVYGHGPLDGDLGRPIPPRRHLSTGKPAVAAAPCASRGRWPAAQPDDLAGSIRSVAYVGGSTQTAGVAYVGGPVRAPRATLGILALSDRSSPFRWV